MRSFVVLALCVFIGCGSVTPEAATVDDVLAARNFKGWRVERQYSTLKDMTLPILLTAGPVQLVGANQQVRIGEFTFMSPGGSDSKAYQVMEVEGEGKRYLLVFVREWKMGNQL